MIVKREGPIQTFAKWKAMVQNNSDKVKKYGITFLYAGTEKNDDTKFIAIIKFNTMEGMQGFKGDEELHKERAAAGVDLANTTTTPMGDDFLEQFKG